MSNISSLISENVLLLNDNAKRKNISLQNIANSYINALCDKNITNTILRNLISNAIKFASDKGTITIDATENGSNIEIQVLDSGKGIPADIIQGLFNIAANRSTLGISSERGTGLGLPLCKELGEKLGGQIWVENEPGKSSTFFFTISCK